MISSVSAANLKRISHKQRKKQETQKKRPAEASLFANRDATSREVLTINPLGPQAGTRGVASRFTTEGS